MIIQLDLNTPEKNVKELIDKIRAKGLDTNYIVGDNHSVIGIIGDTSKVDIEEITKEQCPYCGLPWESRETLDLAFKEKTQNLSSLLDDIAPKIEEVETEIIKNNIEPLEKRINEYLDKKDVRKMDKFIR